MEQPDEYQIQPFAGRELAPLWIARKSHPEGGPCLELLGSALHYSQR